MGRGEAEGGVAELPPGDNPFFKLIQNWSLRRRPEPGQKSGPIAGAAFQRGQGGGRLSGKAMEVAVPAVGTVLREML